MDTESYKNNRERERERMRGMKEILKMSEDREKQYQSFSEVRCNGTDNDQDHECKSIFMLLSCMNFTSKQVSSHSHLTDISRYGKLPKYVSYMIMMSSNDTLLPFYNGYKQNLNRFCYFRF